MDLIKDKKSSTNNIFVWLIIFLLLFSMFCGSGVVTANAAEATSGSEKVQNNVDNSVFITFSKGESADKGQYIYGCFYVPDTVYDSSLEYGVVVFPKWFAERYGITGNYIEEYTAIGKYDSLAIMVVPNPTSISEGKILKCGIINIPEAGENMELSFIFFVRDSEGNIAYEIPRHAAYATLIAEDYTYDELAKMIGQRVKTESSFGQIVIKIKELVDSVWVYVVIALASVIVVWGAYIGIKIIIAKKNDEKINARDMVKQLIIGIVIMFVLAVGLPLLINGLISWFSW